MPLIVALALAGCDRDAPLEAPASVAAGNAAPASGEAATRASIDPGDDAPADAAANTGLLDATVVAATDTLASLRARHGAASVVATKVPGAEGEQHDGWVLYPDDPARRLHVYLDERTNRPSFVRVLDRESRWRRDDGIRMGVTLAELAARNGRPVGFTGFDWDYGGGCCDWNGGTLERDPPTGGMTLCPPQTNATFDPGYPMGDAQFDSNHPWVVAHPPAVCEFGVALEPPP